MSDDKVGLRRVTLVLVTDDKENNHDGQPTRFHVARRMVIAGGASTTACGRKNFKGLAWSFYRWIYKNTDVMCPNCVGVIESQGGVIDGLDEGCPF